MELEELIAKKKQLEKWIEASEEMIACWKEKLEKIEEDIKKCGNCLFWEITEHEGHNIGYCLLGKVLLSRFTCPCRFFEESKNPPQAYYGLKYRNS